MTDNDRAAKIEAVMKAMETGRTQYLVECQAQVRACGGEFGDYFTVEEEDRRMAAAALDALEPFGLDAPTFEWTVDDVIEAREDAGEPGDPDTAQRVADLAHDVLLTFRYTLQVDTIDKVVWLMAEMLHTMEQRIAAIQSAVQAAKEAQNHE